MKTRRNHSIERYAAFLFGAVLFFAGCSHDKNKPESANSSQDGAARQAGSAGATGATLTKGSGSFQGTFQSNVHVMGQDEGTKALLGVSSNDAGLLFDASNETARQLKAGDVLLIKGLLARTVLAAETTPDGIMVLTQQAAIPDVIQDADITVRAPVRFGMPRASLDRRQPANWFSLLNPLSPITAYAQSPESVAMGSAESKGTVDAYGNLLKGAAKSLVEGWETSLQATPGEGKTNLDLVAKKNVGGFVAMITGQGYISNFDFDSAIAVKQSTLQQMKTSFKGLNGQMNFQWVVAKDSPGVMAEESRIKLPGALDIPLAEFVGGIPLYLEVSAAILIHPGITGGKEYSKGQFRITYEGNQNFVVKSGNIDANGNITGGVELVEHQELSPTAPLAMLVAFAAPRIELTLGLTKIWNKSDMKKAADIVDKYADQIAKRLLSPQQYNAYRNGPLGGFKLGQTMQNALSTDGAAYVQLVGTSASSFTGTSVLTPCSRYDMSLVGSVGASAEVWGKSAVKVSKEIFHKSLTKIDPPGIPLCENIGKQ